ncbi:hypothetical protein JCM16303_005302 [Sporobolomyces ruberrimus]
MEEHSITFVAEVDKETIDATEDLKLQLADLKKKELGRDVLSPRVQTASNSESTSKFAVFTNYPPTAKSRSDGTFYGSPCYTIGCLRCFNLQTSTVGSNLYPIETVILPPEHQPTTKNLVLYDPKLFRHEEDVDLGEKVFNIATDFSLARQIKQLKSGAVVFVVG